jgi:hypothetical protein
LKKLILAPHRPSSLQRPVTLRNCAKLGQLRPSSGCAMRGRWLRWEIVNAFRYMTITQGCHLGLTSLVRSSTFRRVSRDRHFRWLWGEQA